MPGRINTTVLIAAIVVLSLFGLAGMIGLTIKNNGGTTTPLIVTLLGFLGTTIAGLMGLLKSQQNAESIQRIEQKIDTAANGENSHDNHQEGGEKSSH